MIYIVGLGPGHKDYIMPKALNVLKKSHLILGFKRAIDSLDFIDSQKIYLKSLSDIDKFIGDRKIINGKTLDNKEKLDNEQKIMYNYDKDVIKDESINISIVASGDPTFYGVTNYIKNNTKYDFEIIPGISSFQYLTSKVKLPWNEAYLGSLHGRREEFLEKVNKQNLTIWLTDKENNPAVLCEILNKAKIECTVIIGENLSYEDEVISIGLPNEFLNRDFSTLNIFIVNRN